MKKAVVILALVLVPVFMLSSCLYLFINDRYNGEYKELYTVAVNNIFGIHGYWSNGEVVKDPTIEIIETDDYGRVLFLYSEYYNDTVEADIEYGIAFVIMQKCDDDYVYYYQDDCYVPFFEESVIRVYSYDEIKKLVDPQMLIDLKARNDWNQAMDKSKFTKTKIDNEKPEDDLNIKEKEYEKVLYEYAVKNGCEDADKLYFGPLIFCNADSYGRELYYVFASASDDDGKGGRVYTYYDYAIIYNPDKTCSKDGIAEITDKRDSYDIIKTLKENNNWDNPY